jgi:transcriptional regulator with XRE-family HTH domain
MSGKKEIKEMKNLLSEYIENLEKGQERTDLLEALKLEKDVSEAHENIYKDAALAQFLYYNRLAEECLPIMRLRFKELRNKLVHSETQDIWSYLELTMEQKGWTWKDVLGKMGADPRFAGQIRNRKWSLQRISPCDLAHISNWLEADPNQVLRLSYANLKAESAASDYGKAAHFRAAFDQKDEIPDHKQVQQDTVLQYLKELEKALNEGN